MGLIFNTPATIEMTEKVNSLFSNASIGWWRQTPQRNWFSGVTTKKKLHEIAKTINLFPSNGEASNEGQNWIKWLKEMHKGSGTTPAEQILKIIDHALEDNPKCVEIFFSIIPTSANYATVTPSKVGPPNAYTRLITIETPTLTTMKRMVRRRAAARRKARTKKKS